MVTGGQKTFEPALESYCRETRTSRSKREEERSSFLFTGVKREAKRAALHIKDTSIHMQLWNISGSPTFYEKNLCRSRNRGTMSRRGKELEKGKGRKKQVMLYRGFLYQHVRVTGWRGGGEHP
jgi:hypothetical protein